MLGELLEGKLHEQFLWGGAGNGRESLAPRQSFTRQVNHREEKDTLGVGQAQLWNVTLVPKQPVLAVAAYSALLLASLQAFGAERGQPTQSFPSGVVTRGGRPVWISSRFSARKRRNNLQGSPPSASKSPIQT